MKNRNESLQSIYQGEKSAVEAYDKVIAKAAEAPVIAKLRQIRSQHETALRTLESWLLQIGAEIPKDSGSWGSFTAGLTEASKAFGETSALSVLKTGEKHGLNQYQGMLENKEVPADFKSTIRSSLIPMQEIHIAALDGIKVFRSNS